MEQPLRGFRFSFIYLLLATLPATLFGFPVEVSEAPTNNLRLALNAIQAAKKTLHINIYELTSAEIVQAIIEQVNDGISVELIEEGQPVGGFSAAASNARARIVKAMKRGNGGNHFYMMAADTVKERRFHFDHAKYIVVDGNKQVLVGSENYSATGNPQPGTKGNRGWQVLLHDSKLAGQFKKLFDKDADASFDDIEDLVERTQRRHWSLFDSIDTLAWEAELPWDANLRRLARDSDEGPTIDCESVDQITSPDTSLSGLLGLINGAKRTIDIEQMTFSSKWGSTGKASPLFTAVMKAARRGIKVRVLLNDETVFSHGRNAWADPEFFSNTDRKKNKNLETVEAFNDAAEKDGLDIEARIADVKEMKVTYIHNKGMLVDDDKVLVSSINWNQNAVENNREAAVVLHGSEAHDHYLSLFNRDWKASER